MPIYEYVCSKCGKHQEQILKFDERESPDSCSECGASGAHLSRQISQSSFRLQPGLGWGGWDKDKNKAGWVTRELTGSKVPTDQ